MYGRFESGVHPREPLGDLLLSSRDHCTSLEDHVQHLTKVSISTIELIDLKIHDLFVYFQRITSFKNLISKSAKKLHNAARPKELVEINDNK